jgi:hypothetical protein
LVLPKWVVPSRFRHCINVRRNHSIGIESPVTKQGLRETIMTCIGDLISFNPLSLKINQINLELDKPRNKDSKHRKKCMSRIGRKSSAWGVGARQPLGLLWQQRQISPGKFAPDVDFFLDFSFPPPLWGRYPRMGEFPCCCLADCCQESFPTANCYFI